MEAGVDTIRKMSETLKSSGFTRSQSDAFIESMALAIKTFAVTPEVLDDRLAGLRKEFKEMLSEQKLQTDQRFDGVDQRLDGVDRRLDEMGKRLDEIPKLRSAIEDLKEATHDTQRSILRYFIGFTLAILAGLMGALGAILGS